MLSWHWVILPFVSEFLNFKFFLFKYSIMICLIFSAYLFLCILGVFAIALSFFSLIPPWVFLPSVPCLLCLVYSCFCFSLLLYFIFLPFCIYPLKTKWTAHFQFRSVSTCMHLVPLTIATDPVTITNLKAPLNTPASLCFMWLVGQNRKLKMWLWTF